MAKTKIKPGSAAELAAMYPGPKRIPVHIVRVKGDAGSRTVEVEESTVTVYALPVEQLGRVMDILLPVLELSGTKPFTQFLADHKADIDAAIAEATGYSVEDIRCFDGNDHLTVVNAIIERNADFFVRLLGQAAASEHQATIAAAEDGDGRTQSPTFVAGAIPTPSATHSPSSMPQ